jgi:UDPglucose--hexose-1-phosphate uridylyltransferase
MNLYEAIFALTDYGVRAGLIETADEKYTINRYLELFHEENFELTEECKQELKDNPPELSFILDVLIKYGIDKNLLPDDGITACDLFDTALMGILTGKPSEVIRQFRDYYARSPETATDWFYKFSQDTNYIRRDRIKKDRRWKVKSEYGEIDITINLSKPEKDPRAIAAAKSMKQTAYPKCQLCVENEGYAGRLNHPARQNHRIIPIRIADSDWGFQYSPYVYYNEHCIVLNSLHTPMAINHDTYVKLFDFVEQFPHYFLGSNADLPIVGGSILSHDHFQGGHYSFAIENAAIEKQFKVEGFEGVRAGIVHWPLSVIRLQGESREDVIRLADHILKVWRNYTDEEAFIYAETDGEPHNTITPIARMHGKIYELDLTLRNNITTPENPLGVYHPHAEYHHIKKENIGLIEVMGLAVLPARLDREMKLLGDCLTEGKSLEESEELLKHKTWAEEIQKKYPHITSDNVNDILQEEIGKVFIRVLENAGVFKCDEGGRRAFKRFIDTLS